MIEGFRYNTLQESALERLSKVSAHVISLSPGTGKTVLILGFMEGLLNGTNDKCIFMIPKSARASFEKELKTRIQKPYLLIVAGKTYSFNDLTKHQFIIIENTIVHKHSQDLVRLAETCNCHLVIDEAHSLQNPDSVFTRAAWEVRCYCKRVYAMTATPLLNDIEGLYHLYHFVFPSIFKSWFRFRARYCITKDTVIRTRSRTGSPIQRKVVEIVGYQNMQELNEYLDKLTIKGSVKYDVEFAFKDTELDERAVKKYQLASKGLYDLIYHPEKVRSKDSSDKASFDNRKDYGSRLHDLQRIVDLGDPDTDSFVSNKMRLMLDSVREVMNRNEATLIYFEYKDVLERAEAILLAHREELGFNNVYRITGEEKESLRVKIETSLQPKDIVLCSQAASQSRNLQRANNIICFHLSWAVGRIVQTLGRICRCDTEYPKQNIVVLSVRDSIDAYKVELFQKRLGLINALLGNEAIGVLDNYECSYLDVDLSDVKELKNNLLWRRNK